MSGARRPSRRERRGGRTVRCQCQARRARRTHLRRQRCRWMDRRWWGHSGTSKAERRNWAMPPSSVRIWGTGSRPRR
eukprot:scaffold5770_cov130-Isochrysis_galbana.AAC.1